MYSIGEFSRVTGLTVKTLRFYHERGLLEPAAVDPASGYRYYDERNVQRAAVIRALRDLEVPLDDVAVVLADCSDDVDLVEYLGRHRHTIAEKARHYEDLLAKIDQVVTAQRKTEEATAMRDQVFEPCEREIEPQLVAGVRFQGKYSDVGPVFGSLARQLGRHIAGKPLCLYYDGDYREDDADIEACFPIRKQVPVNGADVRELLGGRCVTLLHHGPYEQLGRSYAVVLKYARDHGYDVALPTREVYVKGPGMIFPGNPKRYLTEIVLPIAEPASE
ncbi:MAG: MerR family transcriptional regulator [Planctomycetales bacterium]|nr:MerR family transcriptional regulator [Planctomycetales bacterium]